jgi:hypothetical protein
MMRDWRRAMSSYTLRQLLAAVALLSIGLAACGADDPVGPDGNAGTEPARTEPATSTYIEGLCSAAARMFAAYQKSFQENREALGGMDPTDAYARTARAPFAALISDLERLSPPDDARAAHAESIRQAQEVLEALREGDRQKLLSLRGTPDTGTWKQVVDLAPELKSRFGEASLEVGSCQELESAGGGNPFR